MIELPQYSNSTKRQALLAITPGTLTYSRVRWLARSHNIDWAIQAWIDIQMYGHASKFARKPDPTKPLTTVRRTPTAIYWANRRYPTPEIIQRLIKSHLIK